MTKLTQQEIERERKRFEEFAQKNNIPPERWQQLWETWLAGVLSTRELFLSELEMVTKKGNLGKYITKIRVDLSMTQAAMAKKLGISGAMLSSIEKRKKHISSSVVDRFIAEFGLNESEQQEFIKLSIMNNVAIDADKVTKKLLGRKNG